jgi:hypothetical protein
MQSAFVTPACIALQEQFLPQRLQAVQFAFFFIVNPILLLNFGKISANGFLYNLGSFTPDGFLIFSMTVFNFE